MSHADEQKILTLAERIRNLASHIQAAKERRALASQTLEEASQACTALSSQYSDAVWELQDLIADGKDTDPRW